MEKPDITKVEQWEASGKKGKKPTKSKKSKVPEPLTEDQLEKLPGLPESWKWVAHSEIAIINPPKPNGNESSEVTFLPMPAVEEVTGRYSLSETRKLGEVRKGYTGFIEGDVIFAKITPCMENGKVAFLEKLVNGIGFGSTEFHVSRPTSNVFGKYLFHYLVQQKFRKEAKRNMTGSAGQLRVPSNYFAEQPFPLAPLPEQRAIVSKIEQLFSELDNGIANLKLAQEQLKVYRQAVLKKAFEGELTRKWREQQTDLPDAEGLLEEIKKKREEAATVSGKKSKPINPLTEAELNEFLILPEKWKWVKVGELCEVVRGGSPRPAGDSKYYGGEIPFLKVADLTGNNDVYLKEYEYTIKEAGLKKTRLVEKNTLLLSNSGATLGIPKICSFKTTFNDGIAAFLDLAVGSLLYHYYFWLSKTKELRAINQGAAQPNLNTDIIANYSFPLCSLPEQQAIVQEIETRLSVCDKIEQDIEMNLERAEALRQSILKKAFEGKLLNEKELAEIRKAEDWEPAEVLLERIKTEREGNGKSGKQTPEKSKKIIQNDKGLTQQATIQVFEQIDN